MTSFKNTKVMNIHTSSSYFQTRFTFDPCRTLVWQEIAKYLQKYIPDDGTLLELGAGYCDFINAIAAQKKIAIDLFPELKKFAGSDVNAHIGNALDLDFIEESSINTVFASNFFEHLTREQFLACIEKIYKLINHNGRLIVIQPNYHFCYKNYYDDFTHLTVFSHKTMADWLTACGFTIEINKPKFLPFSMQSKMPKSKLLVRCYLHSPFKPLAKQFLIIASK